MSMPGLAAPQTQQDGLGRLLHTFHEIRDELFRSLCFMLGNRDDAQDALQTGFLHCWQARGQLDGLNNMRAWVWRVGLNAGRDLRDRAWRRRSRLLAQVEGTARCSRPAPTDSLITKEEKERLRAALTRLRPEEKEVFLLRQNEALTFEQIARRRRSPVASGKTLMRSALRKLRLALEDV